MPVWAWLGGAILLEVIGTTALQQSAQFTRLIPTVIMAVCYGLAFYALSVVVQYMPMGVVYAIWSGAGIALIAAGVVVINMFSGAGPH